MVRRFFLYFLAMPSGSKSGIMCFIPHLSDTVYGKVGLSLCLGHESLS